MSSSDEAPVQADSLDGGGASQGGVPIEASTVVRDAVLELYCGVTTKAIEGFDDIVSAEPATLVIGTAPGEG